MLGSRASLTDETQPWLGWANSGQRLLDVCPEGERRDSRDVRLVEVP